MNRLVVSLRGCRECSFCKQQYDWCSRLAVVYTQVLESTLFGYSYLLSLSTFYNTSHVYIGVNKN